MTELILKPSNQSIEIDEKYGISTEGCIADIRDLERTSGASSKTLFITSNDEVNQTLGSIFNINIDDSLSFDLQVKQECQLWHNGELIMDGFFQIVNIDYVDKFHYLYEIVVFDEQINLFLEIEENLIVSNPDPSKDLDFSQYDHQYIWDNVEGSFNKGPYQLPYVYLKFDNERTFWDNVDDYKLGFYVESLYREIFAKYGYTIESDFFKEQLFKDLVIPFSTRDDLPLNDENSLDAKKIEADNDWTDSSGCSNIIGSISSTIYPSFFTDTRNFGIPIEPQPDVNPVFSALGDLPFYAVPLPLKLQTFGDPDLFRDVNGCSNNLGGTQPLNYDDMWAYTPTTSGSYNLEIFSKFRLLLNNANPFLVTSRSLQNNPLRNILFRVDLLKYLNPGLPTPGQNWENLSDVSQFEVIESVIHNTGIIWSSIPANDSMTTPGEIDLVINNVQLNAGSQYIIRLVPLGMNYEQIPAQQIIAVSARFEIGGEWDSSGTGLVNPEQVSLKVTANQTFVSEGDNVVLNQWLPQIKQKDLVKSINKMFNLKMAPLKGKEKTILIEPTDDFYRVGDQIDLNNNEQFYIIDSQSKYNVLTEFQTREVMLKWKDDSDSTPREVDLQNPDDSTGDLGKFILFNYKNSFKAEYGQQRILFNNENTKNELEIEPIFSPTPIVRSTDFETGSDRRQYITSAMSALSPKNNFKVLFKNVLPNTTPYVALNGRPVRSFFPGTNLGNTAVQNGTAFTWFFPGEYCTATHFMTDPFDPKFDLNWGRPLQLNFNFDKLTDNNLFQDFWLNTVRRYNEQRMITVKAYISNTEYNKLDWNTKLYADLNEYNGYFIINKIKEYNVKTGEAILELITYDLGLEFDLRRPIGFSTGTVPIINTTNSVLKPGPNVVGSGNLVQGNAIDFNKSANKSLTLGNNNTNSGGLVIGDNNTTSGKKTLVIGDNHTGQLEEGTILSNNVNTNKIGLLALTEDPTEPVNGQIWFREDLGEFRIYINGIRKLNFSDTDEDIDPDL